MMISERRTIKCTSMDKSNNNLLSKISLLINWSNKTIKLREIIKIPSSIEASPKRDMINRKKTKHSYYPTE